MSDEGFIAGFDIVEDNVNQIIDDTHVKLQIALMKIGIKVEAYAKARCPVGTVESTGKKGYRGGTLRNSITHEIKDDTLIVGSGVEYAPYVELGTGPYFDTPPEWEQFDAPKGSGIGTGYVHPRPFIRPAILDHLNEYEKIVENELK